jgi:threonine aldolase
MSIDLCNEPSVSHENMQNDVVQTIEKKMAQLFQKENALYLPSRYISNMCAVLSQYGKNSKILLGDKSHMFLFDKTQYGFNGISWKSVPTLSNGAIQLEKIDIDTDNIGMICIEDMGIRESLPKIYLESLHEILGGLPIHLDGIHIWNSIIRKKISPSEIAKYFDSMTIHLSKCSGGSYGAMLLGSNEFIEKARSVKNIITQNDSTKMAMSFLEILDDFESGVLEDTYAKAKKIADAMNRLHIFKVQPLETNVIFADIIKPLDAITITKIMKENGVIISTWAHQLVRMVIHKNISDSNLKTIIKALQKLQERLHIFEIQ